MHNDHTDGFADLVQSRWAFHGTGAKIDAVYSADVASPQGVILSCRKFVTHMADAFIQSGEIAQRTAPQAGASPMRSSRSLSHITNGIDTTITNVLPTIWPARNSSDP